MTLDRSLGRPGFLGSFGELDPFGVWKQEASRGEGLAGYLLASKITLLEAWPR